MDEERCTAWAPTTDWGEGGRCMRAAVSDGLCRQHAAPKARKRSNGVAGSNYVTHVTEDGVKTLCGREAGAVNKQPESEGVREYTCKACAKRMTVQEVTRGTEDT